MESSLNFRSGRMEEPYPAFTRGQEYLEIFAYAEGIRYKMLDHAVLKRCGFSGNRVRVAGDQLFRKIAGPLR